MEAVDIVGLAGVPFIVALVEGVKWVWPTLEPRWYPAVAVAWGLAINIGFVLSQSGDLWTAALYGLIAGLSASGLYSASTTVGIRGKTDNTATVDE